MMKFVFKQIFCILIALVIAPFTFAQFIDEFEAGSKNPGWGVATGDGDAKIQFKRNDGFGAITVDATNDKLNIWWAIIRLPVPGLNMEKLIQPDYELRVEAKIKVSHSPRRVNLHFNHSRTTDFHSHLKEYDIGDTANWHTISMTTSDFEVQKNDQVNVQMALMDWGNQVYSIDIDYFRVNVVNKNEAAPDLGNPQDYHPPFPNLNNLSEKITLQEDAILDKTFPDRNFNNWQDPFSPGQKLLAVNQNKLVIMRADFSNYKNTVPDGWGVLKMQLHHMENSPEFKKDFGMIRLVEIVGGSYEWNDESVTYHSFMSGEKPVFNGQMIIDLNPAEFDNKSVHFTLSEPVLKRLFSGETKGLALLPLGAITASFYASETAYAPFTPEIYFNIK